MAVIRVQSLRGNDVLANLRGGYAIWVSFHCRPSESGKLMAGLFKLTSRRQPRAGIPKTHTSFQPLARSPVSSKVRSSLLPTLSRTEAGNRDATPLGDAARPASRCSPYRLNISLSLKMMSPRLTPMSLADTPLMRGDLGIDQLGPEALERSQCGHLVGYLADLEPAHLADCS